MVVQQLFDKLLILSLCYLHNLNSAPLYEQLTPSIPDLSQNNPHVSLVKSKTNKTNKQNNKKTTCCGVWIKPAWCVALGSVAKWITEWTEVRVRGWSWTAALLLGEESNSWKKKKKKDTQGDWHSCSENKNYSWPMDKLRSEKTKSFGLTMSLPEEEESEDAEDDDEWCWGLGRKTGDGEGESALRGEEVSLWSSMETSISRARSCSQLSTSRTKRNTTIEKKFLTD